MTTEAILLDLVSRVKDLENELKNLQEDFKTYKREVGMAMNSIRPIGRIK